MPEINLKVNKPLVSVIIPTYNSSATFESCLLSIKAQTYPNVEIIVVDNFSKDSTTEIARNFGVKVFLLKSNLPSARNFGLSHANGKYVLHLDSDMCPTSKVIEECVRKCEEDNFDALSIPELSVGKGFWGKCFLLEKFLYFGDEGVITPRFCRRMVLDTLGGSDENLDAGEDWDLWVRLKERGYSVRFIRAYLIHHEGSSLTVYLMKKYRWAKTVYKYFSKHPSNALRQWTPLKPRNLWYNRKKILRNPQYFMGMLFLKLIRLFIGFVGFLTKE